jgi:hypothetical protein
MIKLGPKFLSSLEIYNGRLHYNKSGLDIEYPIYAIWFDLENKTVAISDLIIFKDWYIIKSNLKKKEIQSLITKYFNTYNNLKVFY